MAAGRDDCREENKALNILSAANLLQNNYARLLTNCAARLGRLFGSSSLPVLLHRFPGFRLVILTLQYYINTDPS